MVAVRGKGGDIDLIANVRLDGCCHQFAWPDAMNDQASGRSRARAHGDKRAAEGRAHSARHSVGRLASRAVTCA